jgi:hypothetical protein
VSTEVTAQRSEHSRGIRIVIAIALVVLLVAYSVAVIMGLVGETRKIDAVHFALIVLTGLAAVALVKPESFERLKRLKLSGFELEMLEKVKERQALHEDQLEDIRLILPLLLPEPERKHLFNLDLGKTGGYQGNHALRSELRRLRSMGLVRMRQDRRIEEMKDGRVCDLASFVELTPRGHRWVRRVKEIEGADAAVKDGPE